jgi:hypothetical protein
MNRKYVFVLIVLGLLGFASIGSATVIMDPSNGEGHLYQVYNSLCGTAYLSSSQLPQVSDSLDNLWTETNGQVLVEVRNAGFSQELGYRYNGSDYPLISVNNGFYTITIDMNVPNGGPFSWVDKTSGGTWYSNDFLNSDNMDHFIAFTTPKAGEYILAFEDWPNSLGDKDYNDLIIKVKQVAPVPEPSTFLLLGAGIIGIGLARKRFRK